MSDISEFLGRVLADGVQRTNRYRCKLDVGPLGLSEYDNAAKLLREGMLCRTTSTPTRQMETTTVDLSGGYEEKYAIGTQYTDLDCTFLCPLIDGKTEVLSLFHRWQNLIQDHREGGDMVLAFPKSYRLEQGLTLELLSQKGDREEIFAPKKLDSAAIFNSGVINQPATTASFQYYDVYPLFIAGTTVDWAMMDEMMEVSVTFSFTHWRQVS